MIETTPWIQTFTGKRLDLDPPNPDQIDIVDIAHGLSMLCRFNGQCTRFYSVAEHSVHVSHEIAPELALVGLLHDAAEAYLGDVPSPLKGQLSQFKTFEKQMEQAIGEKFRIEYELFVSKELKRADVQLLIDEKAVLMVDTPEPWLPGEPAVKDMGRIKCWGPEEAKVKFLERFAQLTGIQVKKITLPTPHILPDILTNDLKTIFCGTAVGRKSAGLGQYYANKSNTFWKTLYDIGITDERLEPNEQTRLKEFGIGLTDLAKTKVGMDRELLASDFMVEQLTELISSFKPRSIAFNGKKAAETVCREKVQYGLHFWPNYFPDTQVWVLPSTAGTARGYFDISIWHTFSDWMGQIE